jgi:hypothetical protein
MTTELTRYNGYRYVLQKGRNFSDDAEKMKAGHAMSLHADMVVWESNAALVARVESFLQNGFSWYSKKPKPARETLQTLLAYVRDGAVIVSQENGATTIRWVSTEAWRCAVKTRSIDTNNVGVTDGFKSSKTVHHHRFFSGRCTGFGLSGRA